MERFSQLNPEEISDLFLSTQLISGKIEEFYQGKSLSIAIQDGEHAGQTIKVFFCFQRDNFQKNSFSMFMFIFFQDNPMILKKMIQSIMRSIH